MRIEMHNTQYVPHEFLLNSLCFFPLHQTLEKVRPKFSSFPGVVAMLYDYVYSFPFILEPETAYVNTVICINKTIPFAYIHLLDTE